MTTEFIVYGGIAITIVLAFVMGKSLDKQQSNEQVTWKTGCIGYKTLIEAAAFGLIGGPIVYLIKGGNEGFWLCVLGMATAPFLVDLLRPVVTVHPGQDYVESPSKNIKTAHVFAVLICIILVVTFVVLSRMQE